MGLNIGSKLSALASDAVDAGRDHAGRVVDAGRDQAGRAAGWLGDRDPSATGRLRAMLDDDSSELSVEAFIVLLVDTINEDELRLLSAEEVERSARRRARRAGMLGLFGGPAGLSLASCWSEALLACDVIDRHGLDLDDEQISAHLLVLWKLSPDVPTATASIDGSGPSVAAQLVDEHVTAKPLTQLSPMEALMSLWRLRKLADPDSLPGSTRLRDVALPKKRVREVTRALEEQLGVAAVS